MDKDFIDSHSARILPMFRDGPLSRRPPEEIRYGTGKSAVGPVLVASSDKGIVTVMVREKPDQLIRDIRARFPKAELVRDEKGCAPIGGEGRQVHRRARSAASSCRWTSAAPICRSACGTRCARFRSAQTSTYSKIAEAIGAPKAIRAVAQSCSRSWFAFAVPCHRVLHKGGASPGNRRDGRQYRWVDYEHKLDAKRLKRSAR